MTGGAQAQMTGSSEAAEKQSLSADYRCLLGLADALAPGTYIRLAGDPDVLESRFVELFESF